MNICVNCKHFKEVVREGTDMYGNVLPSGMWYNQFCTHKQSTHWKGISPVNGKEVFLNAKGHESYHEFEYARNVNKTGDCPIYEAIGGHFLHSIDWAKELKDLKRPEK